MYTVAILNYNSFLIGWCRNTLFLRLNGNIAFSIYMTDSSLLLEFNKYYSIYFVFDWNVFILASSATSTSSYLKYLPYLSFWMPVVIFLIVFIVNLFKLSCLIFIFLLLSSLKKLLANNIVSNFNQHNTC